MVSIFNICKFKSKKELKKLYEAVQAEVDEFNDILYLLQEYNVKTISELIRKHPREAYINGIIRTYDETRRMSEKESEVLANIYLNFEKESVEEILEDIKNYNGDYEDACERMTGILNYCRNNIVERYI